MKFASRLFSFASLLCLLLLAWIPGGGARPLLINEIMYHPVSENDAHEYIELLNAGAEPLSLAGWRISDGVAFEFPERELAPGELLVVAADVEQFSLLHPEVAQVVGNWSGSLRNKGERIQIQDAWGQVVDEVRYADEGDWAVRTRGPMDRGHEGWTWNAPHDGEGRSLELINPALSNNSGQNWSASLVAGGTPGEPNSSRSENMAPLLDELVQFPLIPRSSDPVNLRVRLRDELEEGSRAQVVWRIDGEDEFSSLEMWDDGAHGDGRPRDGRYAVQIPPQPDETIVEYYFRAVDVAGNERTWPAAVQPSGEQRANFLYRVEDAFDPSLPWEPGTPPVYRIIMTEEEREELRDIGDSSQSPSGEAHSNARMNATFISQDGGGLQVRYRVGVRNRGSSSRAQPPNNHRVNFPHDRPWKGVTALNLNFKRPEDQVMGSIIFKLAGLPAAEAHLSTLLINGVNPMASSSPGLYAALEALDSDFARNHFPGDDNGNLYRIREDDSNGEKGDLRYEGDHPDPYRHTYWKNTNEEEDDYSDLIALTDTLNNAPDEGWRESIEAVLNLNQWMRFLALNSLIGNGEGGLPTGKGDDYAMYAGATDRRFVLVPHDFDTLFSNPERNVLNRYRQVSDAYERLLTHPDVVGDYHEALAALRTELFNPQTLDPLFDQVLGDLYDFETVAAMKRFVEDRTEALDSLFPQGLSIRSSLARVDGYYRSSVSSFRLTGRADPAVTRALRVNGILADWDPADAAWEFSSESESLLPGINRIEVAAFPHPDGLGEPLESGFIDLYYEGESRQQVGGELVAGISPVHLDISARHSYYPGVPVLVRIDALDAHGNVQKDLWDASVALSSSSPNVTISPDTFPLRNGAGSVLISIDGSEDFVLSAQWGAAVSDHALISWADEPLVEVSGTLEGGDSTNWSGVMHVTGDVRVPEGYTLDIDPGTLVLIDGNPAPLSQDGIDIEIEGAIHSMGTRAMPVTITAFDPAAPWGRLTHRGGEGGNYHHTMITRGGHSPREGHTQTGPALWASRSRIRMEDCVVSDLAGKIMTAGHSELEFHRTHFSRAVMGPEINDSALMFDEGFISEMLGIYQENGLPPDDNDGIYLHSQEEGQSILIRNSVVAHIDDDGIDTLGADVRVERVIVRDVVDKGISVIAGNNHFSNILIVDADIGISAKASDHFVSDNRLDQMTILTRSVGIQAHDKTGEPLAQIDYHVSNSIIQAPQPVRTDYDPVDIQIYYSLLSQDWPHGNNNQTGSPEFTDSDAFDFHLQPGSPGVNDGDPGGEPDPDGSVADVGFYAVPRMAPSQGGEVIWAARAGPYIVEEDITVPVGVRLVLEAGTSVFFNEGVQLKVQGTLSAAGEPYRRIRLAGVPGAPWVPNQPGGNPGLPDGPPRWGGIHFENSVSDENVLAYADVENAQHHEGSIGLVESRALIDHVRITGTHRRMIYSRHSSALIQNCIFPDMFAEGESPVELGLDNVSEHIKATQGIPDGGYFIIRNNVFGTNRGHNDVIDVDSGRRPDPIVQILDNHFSGAGDELIDLGGDALIAGNLFQHVAKDDETSDRGYANAISSGDAGGQSLCVVVGNVFWDVDHALNLKSGSAALFENNTVVWVHDDFEDRFGNPNVGSVINLYVDEPTGSPAEGAYVGNNVFQEVPRIFGNVDQPEGTVSALEFENNLIDPSIRDLSLNDRGETVLELGSGNVRVDPRVERKPSGWISPRPGSPALGAGRAGQNLGADVPRVIHISGEPDSRTSQSRVELTLGGPGMFAFRYRVNDGDWLGPIPIGDGFAPHTGTVRTAPLVLENLEVGRPYRIEAVGQDFAGNWQEIPTISRPWQIESEQPRLRINEILASNRRAHFYAGQFPDVVELYNAGALPVDLGGMGLSDDPSRPYRFQFPAGMSIPAGGYRLMYGGLSVADPSALGFALDASGDALYLTSAAEDGGAVLDSVTFGLQITDLSIGRTGHEGQWELNHPTPGSENELQSTGDSSVVRINEWRVRSGGEGANDFVEVFNPDTLPVDLEGVFLSNGRESSSPLAALSFIAAHGYAVFGNGAEADVPIRVTFSGNPGVLRLMADNGARIDQVYYGAQTVGVSMGRVPDGKTGADYLDFSTPGAGNPGRELDLTITRNELIPWTHTWRYNQQGVDLGIEWQSSDYDDRGQDWVEGQGLFFREESSLPGPKNTPFQFTSPQQITFYFRTHFEMEELAPGDALELSHIVDDGVIVYLNGEEIYRYNLPQSGVDYDTRAQSNVGNAPRVGPFKVPYSTLQTGSNLLTAELHQASSTSPDAVFGLKLETVNTVTNTPLFDVFISEILASNRSFPVGEGEATDWVEFHNAMPVEADLSGLGLSDDASDPTRWTFPPGSVIPPHGFLVIQMDGDMPASTTNTGFGLDAGGDALFLFERPGAGHRLLDAFQFGLQVTDLSLARDFESSDEWQLSRPTPGEANEAVELGGSEQIRLNEWMARPAIGDDWFELFNGGDKPVSLGGTWATDDALVPGAGPIPPHSYIGVGVDAFQILVADGALDRGSDHVGFKLSGDGEILMLMDPFFTLVDQVSFGEQDRGISEGRYQDGGDDILRFRIPTPEIANYFSEDSDQDGLPDAWEDQFGLNAVDPGDAEQDGDGDGLNNLQEFLAGTRPDDPGSRLALRLEGLTAEGLVLSFEARSGRDYQIQMRGNLSGESWQEFILIPDIGEDRKETVTLPGILGTRFYRVVIP